MFVRCWISRHLLNIFFFYTSPAFYRGSENSNAFHTLSKFRPNPEFSNLFSYSVLADYYFFFFLLNASQEDILTSLGSAWHEKGEVLVLERVFQRTYFKMKSGSFCSGQCTLARKWLFVLLMSFFLKHQEGNLVVIQSLLSQSLNNYHFDDWV